MKICHGQRKCSLTADSATFGKPCKPETRMYLKVVYTCGELQDEVEKLYRLLIDSLSLVNVVPKKVLKDRFDTPPEPDEPHQNDVDHDHDELYDDDQFYKEPEAIPPEPKLQGDLTKARGTDIIPSIITVQSSSVRPPLRNRDDSSLEGELNRKMGSLTESSWKPWELTNHANHEERDKGFYTNLEKVSSRKIVASWGWKFGSLKKNQDKLFSKSIPRSKRGVGCNHRRIPLLCCL